MSNSTTDFFSEFIDEYFAECDEHLTAVRRDLLALESGGEEVQLNRPTLDELFRRYHSLKGLSGMFGIVEAEQLAHQIESYLRAVRREQLEFTADALDALIEGTRLLEQVIAARRAETPPPAIAHSLHRLSALLEARPQAEPALPAPALPARGAALKLPPDEEAHLAAALKANVPVWHFTFTPAPHLAERGINVNVIRSRLLALGDLIHATPRMTETGEVAFEFLVAGHFDETALNRWQDDGLTWQPFTPTPEPAAAGPAPEPPPEPPPARGTAPTMSLRPSNVVRVDLARLDSLMQTVGELVISRARLVDALNALKPAIPPARWRNLQETGATLERQLRDLREGIMRVRLVPVGEVFERMRFVIRDLARETQKQIDLQVSGQETEIDKFVVERLMDPLLHLVRNAVSHGLEPPAERAANGKPPTGRISLKAATSGDMVVIEIEDDGRGVDMARVAAQGRSMGLLAPGTELDDGNLLDIICAPAFSTRDQADRASGRGMGMSAVKNTVQQLGGSLALHTRPGQGSRFTIQLPLTLAIMDALIVSVNNRRFAAPLPSVREVVPLRPETIVTFENNRVLSYRDSVVSLAYLSGLFNMPPADPASGVILVLSWGSRLLGVAVDRVIGLREIVVRPITDPLVQVDGIAGATELGDGRAVLILDAAGLVRLARQTETESRREPGGRPPAIKTTPEH